MVTFCSFCQLLPPPWGYTLGFYTPDSSEPEEGLKVLSRLSLGLGRMAGFACYSLFYKGFDRVLTFNP